MQTIQEQILEEFCRRLGQSAPFSVVDLARLRELLSAGTKVKADDLVKLLSQSPERAGS